MRTKLVFGILALFILFVSFQGIFGIEFFQIKNINENIIPLIILFAFVCEYVDSSLGMGYGTTLTPVLFLMGVDIKLIVPAVLFSELCTGLSAAVFHHFDGNINFLKDKSSRNSAFLLTILSLAGTIIAVLLSVKISTSLLCLIIGSMIVVVGVMILLTINKQLKYKRSHMIVLGTVAAFNKGLSGGGYGPLVTAGQVVSGIQAKSAVAITSFAESFVCLTGLICYYIFGKRIDWSLAFILAIGAILSVPLSTLTVKKISESSMRLIIGVVATLLGILMLSKLVFNISVQV